jgi:molecular chaperone HtpG
LLPYPIFPNQTNEGKQLTDKFQVHLRGLIDLLANHLYSGPEVFLRELLQNAQDAITAREIQEGPFEGRIRVELIHSAGASPTLVIQDNGIGLTEAEVHRFLATIGDSSKRIEQGDGPGDFIGRFGVGLLSCFMVSEEIVVVTRALNSSSTVTWRGRPDGTYSTATSDQQIDVGTRVYLTCREDRDVFFERRKIAELLKHFGSLLPHCIELLDGDHVTLINETNIPWRVRFASEDSRRESYANFGTKLFEQRFMDIIPLTSRSGEAFGAAYILSHPVGLTAKQEHRIYLKGMFVTDKSESILPTWAVFVRAVIDARDLRPTASRDALYEDETLTQCRDELGNCIQDYLIHLAKHRPDKLAAIIQTHLSAVRAMAAENEECYRTFIRFLPFDTTDGVLTIPEFLKRHDRLLYVPSVEQFRQISQVAIAQGIGVINAGYVHAEALVANYADFDEDVIVEQLDSKQFSRSLEELSEDQEAVFESLQQIASSTLKPYRCKVEIRAFDPVEIPAMYTLDQEGQFLRSVEQSREVANSLFQDVLGAIAPMKSAANVATVVFNARNELVQRLSKTDRQSLLETAIKSLYVQSLLLSHQPLSSDEMRLLTSSMSDLIRQALPT